MFQDGPSSVGLFDRVADESHYALSLRQGVSAVTEMCIAVFWVTDTSQFDRFLPVFHRHILPPHAVYICCGCVFHYIWLIK